tara:strand:+ start:2567 stop:2950 length:384 start_codon:yes stop_codon:yes gene_type:complete
VKLSTVRKGLIGESLVIASILEFGLDLYKPCCDDKTIDLLVLVDGRPIKIQVKNHRYMSTKSSITIRVTPTDADIIAVPYKERVFYVVNNKKNKQWNFSIAIRTPRNNQKIGIKFAEEYEEFPYDNI